ncbi:MAG: bifunctional histidinol-phosphatase/imidazoleglycerol-phosphate dehydratase HisB [Flammeovirgaceae bacterium]
MKKLLFIDRDGTIILEPEDEQIDSLEKLAFYPKVLRNLYQLQEKYTLIMVTNQDGLGTESFPEDTFWPAHNKMMGVLEGEGIQFAAIHIDEHFPHENHPNRKPGIGMMTEYLNNPDQYDLANSFVIGDRLSDTELAKNLGAKGIYIAEKKAGKQQAAEKGLTEHCALISNDWDEIAAFLDTANRTAKVHRMTKETDISIELDLDGTGTYEMHTGIGFFDHMLDQLAKHAEIDLRIVVKGDLHIDEHHTIEDTALALGEAFVKALGNKAGINRYGHFSLPMDETLANVALDFSGRPWLVWECDYQRERVGGMPTELFEHFFKSFSDTAKCNLNIQVAGSNEHHKIEATFKALAKAIKMAIKREGSDWKIPSTKGVI